VSYQVIARKYRPQTFADLTGQEHITRTLEHALDQQRLHHAYLFSGARGTGKTTTARILAKGLNCRAGITSQPCLQCPSCLEIAAGNALDVLEIDAASNTGVDNVRDVIINNLAIAPARDRYKVFIIDEVHMLSTSAFNALLKTLEEPPPHVVFILATTELHKVPETILSRCQQFEFRHIATEKIFQRLRQIASAEQVQISDEALRELARAGAGSLRDAQSALDQVIAFSGTEITEEDVASALGLVGARTLARFAEVIARQDQAALLNLIEEIVARGYDLRNFTRELMAYLRHLLVVKSGITSGEVLGVADVEIARLTQLSAAFSEEDLVRFFHLLAATEKEIKDSPHPRFQLELGLIKLTHAARLRALDEVIARLEALEARLSGGQTSSAGNAPAISQERRPPTPPDTQRASTETRPAPPAKPTRPEPARARASASDEPPSASFAPEEPPGVSDFDPFDQMETEPPPALPASFGARPRAVPAAPAAAAAPAPAIARGREVEAIRAELQKLNRGLLLTALEDAQSLAYEDGTLIATFASEDVFARRVRDSSTIFRKIGEQILGRPLRIEVRLGGQALPPADEAAPQRDALRARALANPAVRAVLEKFRGELIEVREVAPGAES
jgi:DNA polymerase-3 subunit gamma/tau